LEVGKMKNKIYDLDPDKALDELLDMRDKFYIEMHWNQAWTGSIYVDLSFLPKENDPDDDVEWPTLSIRLADHEANGDVIAVTRTSYDFDCTTRDDFKKLKQFIRKNVKKKFFRAIKQLEWNGKTYRFDDGWDCIRVAKEIAQSEGIHKILDSRINGVLSEAARGVFPSKKEFIRALKKTIEEAKKDMIEKRSFYESWDRTFGDK
jgi:hypothetical protein